MRRLVTILSVLALVAGPGTARAESDVSPATLVAHTHQTVVSEGYTAIFHFNAPTNPLYTCPRHPGVTSTLPLTTCQFCGLELQPQTHTIGLAVTDKAGQVLVDGKMRIDLADQRGMVQHLDLPFSGYFQGSFALSKGAYALTAHFLPPGSTHEVLFKTTYTSI